MTHPTASDSSRSYRDRQTSTTDDAFRQLVNNHQAQHSAYVKRAMHRQTDAQALFGTMGDNAFRRSKHELAEQLSAEFVHTEAGFSNAKPQHHSSFIVHPEWVSEQVTRQRTEGAARKTSRG